MNSIRIDLDDLETIFEKIKDKAGDHPNPTIVIEQEQTGIGPSYNVKIIMTPAGELSEGYFFNHANYDKW